MLNLVVSTLSAAIIKVGFPAVVAAYLIWALVGGLRGDITAMRQEHMSMAFYLRAICQHTAADERDARLSCDVKQP